MTQRLSYMQQSPEPYRRFVACTEAARQGAVDERTIDLVVVRVAQVNGCAFSLDMHVKQARLRGERALRLLHLPAWRHSTLFVPRERAALAWAEALTRLAADGIDDTLHEGVRSRLSEQELSDLTFVVMQANAWNRLHRAALTAPGSFDTAFRLDKAPLN